MPGQQPIKILIHCGRWQLGQHGDHVGVRFDAVGLGGFNQAVDPGAGMGSLGRLAEQQVLATDHGRMAFSAGLLSSGMRPSVMKAVSLGY